jgi:hypothetical protein
MIPSNGFRMIHPSRMVAALSWNRSSKEKDDQTSSNINCVPVADDFNLSPGNI